MENKQNNLISTSQILGIDFVILKLTNYITWSWFYVTMPFWIIPVILILILII